MVKFIKKILGIEQPAIKGAFFCLPAKEQKKIIKKAANGAIKDQQAVMRSARMAVKSK